MMQENGSPYSILRNSSVVVEGELVFEGVEDGPRS